MKKLLISALALFVVGSVAAQEGLGETYNKAVAAYNSKDFASAATAFETLIDQGLDSEDLDVQSWVATAKKSVPVCYFQMGLTAAKGNDFNTAVENLTKSANKAALYGELQQERMSNMLMAKIYLMWAESLSTKRTTPRLLKFSPKVMPPIRKIWRWPTSWAFAIASWATSRKVWLFSTKSLLRTTPNMRRMS